MKLQILGTGCPKCKQLADNVKSAIEKTGVDAEIEKITEISDIIGFGVMMTPALAIDGEVKFMGKVLSAEEIGKILKEE